MATLRSVIYLPIPSSQIDTSKPYRAKPRALLGAGLAAAFTLLAVVIHGYHPYAEDGGVYLAGVKRLLDPGLYPAWTGFVTAHLRFSLFAPMLAFVVRITGISLMAVLFGVYLLTTWATLFAAWLITMRCFKSISACVGAVMLLAAGLTVPVAGTSLILMDPYVSARSFSTPLGLFAIATTIDVLKAIRSRRRVPLPAVCYLSLALSFSAGMHPLMTGYTLCFLVCLVCAACIRQRDRFVAMSIFGVMAILLSFCVNSLSPAQHSGYAQVALTRSYWFLSEWHWYERLGLIAPILILAIAGYSDRGRETVAGSVAQAGFFAGCLGLAVALPFARVTSSSYAVAMLQPLRVFQIVYCIMILTLGAELGRRLSASRPPLWIAFVCVASISWAAQVKTFPDSAHIELPWLHPTNPWEEGFFWVRNNTPKDAVFALDANYITSPGEDAQNFKAIAERSALPDYSKDGGVASVSPRLAAEWHDGQRAQASLNTKSDPQRFAALDAYHPTWIVLTRDAHTSLDCPYANDRMKVCRLPQLMVAQSRRDHQ